MSSILRTCCVVLSALVLIAPARADDQAEAKAIIDKGIKALGGREALTEQPAHKVKIKGRFFGMGEGIDYTGGIAEQLPDQMRIEITMSIGNQEITYMRAVKAGKGWMSINGMTQDLPKDHLDEVREELHIHEVTRLVGLSGKDFTLSLAGETKVENRPAVGVHVERKDRRDVNLFFDKETGRLVKTEARGKDPMAGDQEFTQETIYSDYKPVGKIQVPHKLEIRRDGKKFVDGETTEYTGLDKLDDALFAKP